MKQACFIIDKTVFFYHELNKIMYLEDDKEKIINLNVPASRCLMLLISKKNTVVHRDEFIQKVWKENNVVVENNTYYQNISILRKCLYIAGLSEDFIITIPKKGLILNENISIEKKIIENNFLYIYGNGSIDAGNNKENYISNFPIEKCDMTESKMKKNIHSFLNIKIKVYHVFLLILFSALLFNMINF